MAVFGVPAVHEDDALRAVRAAVEIRDALAAMSHDLQADLGMTLEIRTEMSTGEVVAGGPFGGETMVTGDSVNVAARLEQARKPGRC